MTMRTIQTPQAPAAIGAYSQAVVVNGFIFTAGQIPLDTHGNMITGDIRAQTRQCLENIKAIVQAAGGTMATIVKVTIFVTDLQNFTAVNAVYQEYFQSNCPARSFVEVSALPKGSSIEIEAVAVANTQQQASSAAQA